MDLTVNFDQATSSLPAGFIAAIDYVVGYFNNLFTNNITVTIDVGYGEIDGQKLSSNALGESEQINIPSVSYGSVRNALIAEGAPGSSTLPTTSSAPSSDRLFMASAEEKAVGLIANNTSLDGYVGFDSTTNVFSYAINSPPPSNEYYFIGVAEHEITEIMGRTSYLDSTRAYSAMDLFRYAAPGTHQFTTGSPSYFSVDNGTTNLDNWNNFQTGNSGDLGDWAPSAGNDSFDDNSNPGVINSISSADLTLMNAIGWTTQSQGPQQESTTNLRYIGTGNFGGADSDILWQSSAGTPTIWLMNGASATIATEPTPPPAWQIVAVGDFNTDGHADILWQSTAEQPAIWLMNGTGVSNATALSTIPPAGWNIVGAGDFYDTGFDDAILWQSSGGQPALWLMNGTTIVNSGALPNPGAGSQIIGAGDFWDTGHDNAILLQDSSGAPQVWLMNGCTVVQQTTLPTPPADWHIRGVGDFYNSGFDDGIVWQNDSGAVAIWRVVGGSLVNGFALTNPGPNWQVIGAGNFNGGSQSDILLENTGTGTAEIWFMNGPQIASTATVTDPPGTGSSLLSGDQLPDTVVGVSDTAAGSSGAPSGSSRTMSTGFTEQQAIGPQTVVSLTQVSNNLLPQQSGQSNLLLTST